MFFMNDDFNKEHVIKLTEEIVKKILLVGPGGPNGTLGSHKEVQSKEKNGIGLLTKKVKL